MDRAIISKNWETKEHAILQIWILASKIDELPFDFERERMSSSGWKQVVSL